MRKKSFAKKLVCGGLVGVMAIGLMACSKDSSSGSDTATGNGGSSDIAPYQFNISYGGTPSSSMVAVMELLCEDLTEASGGAFTFNQYNDNDYKESQALDELTNNIVDIVYLGSSATSTTITDVAYLGMPGCYRYTDDANSFSSFEDAVGESLADIYSDYDIHYLGLRVPAKMAIVGTGEAITDKENLQGKIVRVSGTWMGRLAETMNLATTDVGLSELATALQRKTIDSCITGIEQVYSQMLGEVCDYACVLPETDGMGALVMDEDTWSKLDEAQQAAVNEGVEKWMSDCLAVSEEFYDTSIKALEEYDVDIEYFTDEQCDDFLSTVGDVYEEIDKSASEKGIALKESILKWREENLE
ncbi:TRAP transporter substrate-binding protein [Eubacterium oxidoreducens]|uniref:TRAP-type C4-dicarboxylate transport system, substrate-binding protein n=1 Tax=Eubacterium oxidoreducens TaxID=1732 RepID=A0A1G6CJ48_EUBOX|nr:TRAP transporter substrate-binding protein DctP [Eubacterium oxidoreducens]SDB32907.1 TRAP-type C4-dicarboxylate transport system, substrate-binding protein [Eubacterium oxidoreducens]